MSLRSELLSTTAKVPDGTLGGRLRTFNYRGSDHDPDPDHWFREVAMIDGKPMEVISGYQRGRDR